MERMACNETPTSSTLGRPETEEVGVFMARTSKKDVYMEQLRTMYVTEEKSLSEISGALGPSVQTLSRWLREEEIPLQPRQRNPNAGRAAEAQAEINARIRETKATKAGAKAGGRKRLPRIEVACEVCKSVFETRADKPRKTCSQKCGLWLANERKIAKAQEEWVANPASTCSCGKTIPYANRNEWKYCSAECRQKYGQKKREDPANWVTKSCQNCGNEFRLRKSSQSYGKYCSSACAYRHTKIKQHIVVDDAIVLDSGYEALFWGLCMLLKVPVERYDRSKGVEWREGLWYAPDFWMPTLNFAVELKGVMDDEDPERWDAYREEHGPLIVLTEAKLRKMVGDRGDFLATMLKP